MRFPSKSNFLTFLRSIDYPVGTIVDVGAHAETVDLRRAYPDRRHVLFEPVEEFHQALALNYADVDHDVVSAALSNEDGQGLLQKFMIDGGGVSHASLVDPKDGENATKVTLSRLDTFMASRDYEKPYLLKIDVDGFELPIFEGAENILDKVSCIIMEATATTFIERINAIARKGFRFFDIIDQCYYHGIMHQVDLVFLNSTYMVHPELDPWNSKSFDWKDWNPIARFEELAGNLASEANS